MPTLVPSGGGGGQLLLHLGLYPAPLRGRRSFSSLGQNWLKNGHTSDGIHDIVFPESVGDGVWGPS